MKRKIVSLLVVLVLLLLCFSFSYAGTDGIGIYIDGEKLSTEAEPINLSGHVMVPMRDIFEAMGATVEWDAESSIITATKGLKRIEMQTHIYLTSDLVGIPIIGDYINVNGSPMIYADARPIVFQGHTYVPIRAVSESLDATIEWKDGNVYITSNKVGYEEYPYVPDFGKLYDVVEISKKEDTSVTSSGVPMKSVFYQYNTSSFPSDAMQKYLEDLKSSGFTFVEAREATGNGSALNFKHETRNLYVSAGRSGSVYFVLIAIQTPK